VVEHVAFGQITSALLGYGQISLKGDVDRGDINLDSGRRNLVVAVKMGKDSLEFRGKDDIHSSPDRGGQNSH